MMLVSVVIPCYNQAHFLGEAIESVASQTYEAIETIVVDDGSTDDTAEVASSHAVRCVRQQNQGVAEARNGGMRAARGDVLLFLDSDDWLLGDAIEKLAAAAADHPEAALFHGSCRFVDQGGALNPRERFAGGGTRTPDRLTGAIKAVDPVTGEVKGQAKIDYPTYGGLMTTAGNLVFMGNIDGTFAAYDAKTMQELWSVNLGTGINAPPVTYSVNGKQYVAVLVGSRQPAVILATMPELKNTSTASMLFVFGL